MAYSPAFQIYPTDVLGDRKTIPMTAEEFGAYMLLYLFCWQNDGLPDDIEELADMARATNLLGFEQMWNRRIKKCFVWNAKKKVFEHPDLVEAIKTQKSWKKTKSNAGKIGARNRWENHDLENHESMAVPSSAMAEHGSSSSSSSLSLSSSDDLKRLIERACEAHPKKDKRLVEIAVIETLVNRNGDKRPINSIEYFSPQIKHWTRAGTLAKNTINAVLKRRREQIAKTFD